jgi:hypothetical protein
MVPYYRRNHAERIKEYSAEEVGLWVTARGLEIKKSILLLNNMSMDKTAL